MEIDVPSTIRTKSALNNCMNLPDRPDLSVGSEWNRPAPYLVLTRFLHANRYPLRSKTLCHRESNSAHFFVNSDAAPGNPRSAPVRHAEVLPGGSRLPAKMPLCPFSAQGHGKTDAENPQVNR